MNKHFDILALGSCYVDINTHNFPFLNEGIPPEVELVGDNYEVVPGGSAVNFCVFAARLGLRPAFIGMTGADAVANQLSQLLDTAGVQDRLVQKPELKTGISFNMTNPDGRHIMLVAGDANAALTPAAIADTLEDALKESRMLFLGGCFKLKAFVSAFATIAAMAKQQHVTIAVDHSRIPAGTTPEMLSAVKDLVLDADYYFPSRDEFCELWQVESIEAGLESLHKAAPRLLVVVKDGANGAFFWQDDKLQLVPAQPLKEVVDVTGAGDSFNAGVMAGLGKKLPLREAVNYGCRVAAAKITGQALLPRL